MMVEGSLVKVAVVQAAPSLFDREATVKKACQLVREAAAQGAQLILWPEAFVPAYPRGLSFGTVVGSRTAEGRQLWQRYWENVVEVPGAATDQLGEVVREAGVYLAIGIIERDRMAGGTLYCTLLYYGPDGRVIGKHRKLKPTAAERLIWGEGDGSTFFQQNFGYVNKSIEIRAKVCYNDHGWQTDGFGSASRRTPQ